MTLKELNIIRYIRRLSALSLRHAAWKLTYVSYKLFKISGSIYPRTENIPEQLGRYYRSNNKVEGIKFRSEEERIQYEEAWDNYMKEQTAKTIEEIVAERVQKKIDQIPAK